MTRPRLRRPIAVGIASVAAIATTGIALAQTPGPPTGNFGGGAINVPVSEKTVAKDMLLSIRALPGGKIALGGQLFASCGIGAITGETTLDADGNFALRGVVKRNPLVRVRQETSFLVRGKLTAAGGDGTAKMTLRVTAKGQKAKSCSSRTVNWTVRRPIDTAAVPAPAPGEATLYGLTSQTGGRTKHAIVLHAASAGRRIERLTFGFRSKCSRGRIIAADDVNISPEFDVAADGSFREVERFRVNFSDVIARTTVDVTGRFDEDGAANGTLSVTERYSSRKTGKRVDTCKSGTRNWSASP